METPVLDIAVQIHCARITRRDDANPRDAVRDARELVDAFLTPDPKPNLKIVKDENAHPAVS